MFRGFLGVCFVSRVRVMVLWPFLKARERRQGEDLMGQEGMRRREENRGEKRKEEEKGKEGGSGVRGRRPRRYFLKPGFTPFPGLVGCSHLCF